MLMLQTGMLGVFMSMDLFLFYVFWEVMLVPMYFLIGVWGGARKLYAAIKFFLYTLLGSVVLLLGILAPLLLQPRGDRRLHLQHPGVAGAGLSVGVSVLGVPGLLHRVCHQGSHVPVPHLAPRCPRGGADGRFGDSGRRPAEDGDLRLHPASACPCSPMRCRTPLR